MSYEGSVQFLCKNGHIATFDCYDAPDSFVCVWCGTGEAARKSVDQTNGSRKKDWWPHGLVKEADAVPCASCGSTQEPARYRTP